MGDWKEDLEKTPRTSAFPRLRVHKDPTTNSPEVQLCAFMPLVAFFVISTISQAKNPSFSLS